MDKRTEEFFKNILSEEPADYSHLTKSGGSALGKISFGLKSLDKSIKNIFGQLKSIKLGSKKPKQVSPEHPKPEETLVSAEDKTPMIIETKEEKKS